MGYRQVGQPSTLDEQGSLGEETILVEYVRAYARLVDDNHRAPDGWRYPTSSHLLLAEGRLFTPGPFPTQISKLPDRFCFSNAAATAHEHPPLLYAEGMAALTIAGTTWCLPHAWCATPDGTAIDPTWNPGKGLAYLGIAINDRALWSNDNGGLFDDYQRSGSLLRDGFAPGGIADLGRPVPRVS